MGLRAKIQKAVQKAFLKQMGDLPEALTFRQTSSTYDATTSIVTSADTDTSVTGKLIGDQKRRIGALTTFPEKTALIPARELPGTTPKVGDRVVDPDSVAWVVDFVEIDPAGACWVLDLRRP